MSVQSEIDRIITAVGNAYSKVSEKGGTVPASQTVANLATAIDSIPAGGAKETWVIKSNATGEFATTQIAFTSNGQKFTSIGAVYDGLVFSLLYGNNEIAVFDPGASGGFEFYNEAYRKLTFDTSPAGALLTWLQSNATKQPDDTAVQDTKALTITSNGTVSVTPDAPYDGLSGVDVTVNVSGGGGGGAGFKVTFPATATNWKPGSSTTSAFLWLSDGTIISMGDNSYSNVAGKTFDGVIGLYVKNNYSSYVPRMALMGSVIVNGISKAFGITTDGVTPARFAMPNELIFLFRSDSTISAIEMYNTD